jgi:AraC-like DNA-binding protein
VEKDMAQAIPLVRSIALLPTLRWLTAQGLPAETMLQSHGLSRALFCSPFSPVPLLQVGALLGEIAGHVGPDAACQIVSEADEMDLVQVGRVALGTHTPAEALTRISLALPFFCSHELLSLEGGERDVVIRHAYGVRFPGDQLHLMCQYALAVLDRICSMTGASQPRFLRVEIPPHSESGTAHLDRWYGDGVVSATTGGALKVTLETGVADRRFGRHSRDRSAELARAGLQPLRTDGGFAESVRTLLAAMLQDEEGLPGLGDVAFAAGLSQRTFQRRLKEENRSFKTLLDEVRQERAERLIASGTEPISVVAFRLGYSQPTSLNRSMMRWKGRSPSAYRQARS